MYIPHAYRNTDLLEIEDFIRHNSFAILVNQIDDNPWASHIPLELRKDINGKTTLVGHLAKANAQSQAFEKNNKVLAIFNGPHSYVSSSWYKEEEVPTWNYIAVHVYGTVRIQENDELRRSLEELVDKYEKDSEFPISVSNLSKKTMRQIHGIIGIEIRIDRIEAAYKLSQGREEDHGRIIKELESRENNGSRAVALEMKKKKS